MVEKVTPRAMIDGVRRSAVFVLYVNRDTLSRKYVVLEISVAIAEGKTIVLIYETDSRRDAPINKFGIFDLDLVFGSNTPGSKLEEEINAFVEYAMASNGILVARPDVRAILEQYHKGDLVPFVRRSPHWGASLASLISVAAKLLAEKGNEKQSVIDKCFVVPQIPKVKAEPSSTSALVLHTGQGEQRARELNENLVACGVNSTLLCDASAPPDVRRVSGVLLFCTDGFFKDPKVEYMALQAVVAGVPLMLLQEWNVSCGGVLTLGGGEWDFSRVFGQGKCKHKQLECIPQDTEAMRHRGPEDLPFLVRTYLNVVVEQLSAAENERLKMLKVERPSTLHAGRLSFMAPRRSTASASQNNATEWPDFSEKVLTSSAGGGGGRAGSSGGADPALLDLLEVFGTPHLLSHIAALGVTAAADTTLLSDKELVAVGFTKSQIKHIRVIAAHEAGTGGAARKGKDKGRNMWAASEAGVGAEGIDVDEALAVKRTDRDLWAAVSGTRVGAQGTGLDGPSAGAAEGDVELGHHIKTRVDQRRAADEARSARMKAAPDAANEDPGPALLMPASVIGAMDSIAGQVFASL